ncbi:MULTISPECIES: small ribosomal subunit Rsm22 family protein [Thermoanaerobacterium]|uniref:Ribosomal small subunit Rsm22 n=2 Tax=Thermoanaerobacterium TaxID=28895 RepID=W9E9C5_9THEO|nr:MULTISPECIES: small ribosomal subunit Rsm22 family protein [Thermoanaerobacterium]AFK86391.1 Ribosomal small subunit Rsm22 [Thermoanaerobacterium saccharolyticum JW/SL-YS485]ETO38487.1 Ribosomal small subunit Rsm22 [Thermoanaerobacterium aotearoense SCUT27]
MNIPTELLNGIEEEASKIPVNKLISLVSDISNRYRNTDEKHILSYEEAIAYVSYRMPATFEAIYTVLKDVKDICGDDLKPKSILDVGAGPGTAIWAATSIWNDLDKITLLERNINMIKIGKKLSANSNNRSIKNSIWMEADLESLSELPKHDIVIASYSIGELNDDVHGEIIKKLWESANDMLIIIEPGTKIGFSNIKRALEILMPLGAHVIAPCPHDKECPIDFDDWCHFSSRVQRTNIHRKVKNGQLSYEDEKFSYICVSKSPCNMIKSRIIRHPQIRKGHIILDLCTKDGIKKVTVKKSDGDIYKKARNTKWGSIFE